MIYQPDQIIIIHFRYLTKEESIEYKVDPDHIAVMGQGYGGFVALNSIARGSVQCGIVSSSLTDLDKYGKRWKTKHTTRNF